MLAFTWSSAVFQSTALISTAKASRMIRAFQNAPQPKQRLQQCGPAGDRQQEGQGPKAWGRRGSPERLQSPDITLHHPCLALASDGENRGG